MLGYMKIKMKEIKIHFLSLFYNSHISKDYIFDTLIQVSLNFLN